jgi:hypothetical protein
LAVTRFQSRRSNIPSRFVSHPAIPYACQNVCTNHVSGAETRAGTLSGDRYIAESCAEKLKIAALALLKKALMLLPLIGKLPNDERQSVY